MKTPSHGFAHKLRRISPPVVRESAYKHNPLLIDRLAAFNFRPSLELPGKPLVRIRGFPQ